MVMANRQRISMTIAVGATRCGRPKIEIDIFMEKYSSKNCVLIFNG
jgi:hypothetical protein